MAVAAFREKLKEFESKVVISPLSEPEVDSIESILSRKLPEYYREFLLTIGLKQDAVWGLLDGIRDFDPLTNFLPDNLSEDFQIWTQWRRRLLVVEE